MSWIDIACIVFVCVTVNHLGLVEAVEKIVGKRLMIVNCPKCLTFWVTMAYSCDKIATHTDIVAVLAVSFLASYSALWLELLEGYVDTLYMKLYDKIYNTSDDTSAADASNDNTTGTVSGM